MPLFRILLNILPWKLSNSCYIKQFKIQTTTAQTMWLVQWTGIETLLWLFTEEQGNPRIKQIENLPEKFSAGATKTSVKITFTVPIRQPKYQKTLLLFLFRSSSHSIKYSSLWNVTKLWSIKILSLEQTLENLFVPKKLWLVSDAVKQGCLLWFPFLREYIIG